ncbi:hypothetical protein AB0H69_04400 [Streptomyces phaeochromogenes]
MSRAALARLYGTREATVAAMAGRILADCERVPDEAGPADTAVDKAPGIW